MTVQLKIADGSPFWLSTSIHYTAQQPASASLRNDAEIFWGDEVRFQVELSNLAASTAPATETSVNVYFCDPSTTPQWSPMLAGSPLEVGTLAVGQASIAQDTNQVWQPSGLAIGSGVPETQLHGCLIAVATCAESPLAGPPFASGDPFTLDAVAQRNINITQAPPPPPSPPPGGGGGGSPSGSGGRWFGLGFGVGNPAGSNAHVDLRVRRATRLEAERLLRGAFPRTRFGDWIHADEMGFGVVPIDTPAPAPRPFVARPAPSPGRASNPPPARPGAVTPTPARPPVPARAGTAARTELLLRARPPVTAPVQRSGRVAIADFDAAQPLWASREFNLTDVRAWSTRGTVRTQLGVLAGTQRPLLLAVQTLPLARITRRPQRQIAVFVAEQFVRDRVVGGVAYVVYTDPPNAAQRRVG